MRNNHLFDYNGNASSARKRKRYWKTNKQRPDLIFDSTPFSDS